MERALPLEVRPQSQVFSHRQISQFHFHHSIHHRPNNRNLRRGSAVL